MEALAAIGLAGNIITFLDFGYQILAAANDIHGSATGQVKSDDDLGFETREMRDLSISLNTSMHPALRTSDSEASLKRLAAQCQRWSDDLLSLLEDSRASNPRSRRSTLKAAWSSARNKKRKEQLEKSLATCREQIGIRLTELNSSELLTRLDDLVAARGPNSGELGILKQTVEALRGPAAAQSMDSVVIEELQSLVKYSERMVLTARCNLFLKSLRYDKIRERFDDIPKAYSKTFNWLLEEFDYTTVRNHWTEADAKLVQVGSSRDNSHRTKAREDFTNWLGRQSGVFHITGKPGAGKSTLVKFICEHPRTTEYLKMWSSKKKLVVTKSFLWRLGNDMQKNLRGLLRGIVHQLIVASPELLKIAFPTSWDKCDQVDHVELSSEQIEDGLHLIFADESVMETHCFVLFIDGLDEFDGDQPELLQKLLTWATEHPEHVKMCVSSREWNIFKDAFKSYSKLRIHEYTMDGIATMTANKLALFRPALPNSNQTVEMVNEIVEKAHGVFIWVAIVLKVVEMGVINGNTVPELKAKIRAFPTELGDLYDHLFHSIHECDRRKAYQTLLYTRHAAVHDIFKHKATLLEHHFLDQVAASTCLLRYKIANPPIEVEHIARRLNGRCQGFLELGNKSDNDTSLSLQTTVELMHLTAAEFLDKPYVKSIMMEHIPSFDCLDLRCQTLLAQWKFCPDFLNRASSAQRRIHEIIYLSRYNPCGSATCSRETGSILFNFLREAQELISLHSGKEQLKLVGSEIGIWRRRIRRHFSLQAINDITYTRNIQVLVLAALNCLYKYFDWLWEENAAGLPAGILFASALWGWLHQDCHMESIASFGKMAEACFRLGVSPDTAMMEGNRMSWWQWLICYLLHELPHPLKYGTACNQTMGDGLVCKVDIEGLKNLLQAMLRMGATSTFLIGLSDWNNPEIDISGAYVSDGQQELTTAETLVGIDKTSPLSSYVRTRNGRLTLRELFRFWFNDDDYFSLDSLLGQDEESPSALTEGNKQLNHDETPSVQ
ncbi:hypothetical protein GGR57DRAFT_488135 [Xylariaceae sp. FL1272]|nr:hypothetical protein GGR57DRAFT_488135 [Xylariaceae sp. FL1272]